MKSFDNTNNIDYIGPMDEIKEPVRHRTVYRWDQWIDGAQRRATQGIDFPGTAQAFISAGSAWCRRNGYTWQSTVESETAVLFTITRRQAL